MKDKHIYLLIGGFILDNRKTMVRFLNQGGYAQLKPNSSIQDINDVVAYNITNNDFVTKLITLIANSQSDGYNYMVEIDSLDLGSGGGGAGGGLDLGSVEGAADTANAQTPWGMIASVVMDIAEGVNNMIIAARMALFQRNQARRQELEDRRLTDWQKAQAELNAKKQFSINISTAQSSLLNQKSLGEDVNKRNRNLAIFGVFAVASIIIMVSVVQLKKK